LKRVIALILALAALVAVSSPAFGAVTLEVVWMGWPKNLVDKQLEDFRRANPDISLDIQLVPFNQLFQTLEVRLASSRPPDVFIVDGPMTASYAERGYLMPLDSHLSSKELSAWFPASVEACRYRGKLYTLPYATSSVGLYFNKDIFREHNVKLPPEDPGHRLTWEQVVDIARRLTIDTDGDGQPDIWGLIIEQCDRPYQIVPLAESKGGRPLSPDGTISTGYVNSAAFVEAASFYWRLFNDWKVSPKGILQAPIAREYFGNGKAAMMLGAEWNIAQLRNFPNYEFGLSPHPYFAAGHEVTPTGGWHVGISSKTSKKDAALRFAKYITGHDAVATWAKLFGNAPARRDVYHSLNEMFSDPMWQVFIYEMENTASPRPVTAGYLEYESALKEAFSAIQYGADPAATMNNVAKQIDRELRKYR